MLFLLNAVKRFPFSGNLLLSSSPSHVSCQHCLHHLIQVGPDVSPQTIRAEVRSGHAQGIDQWAHCDSLVTADYLQRSKVNLLRPSIWKRGHHISAYNFLYYRSYFFLSSTSNRSLSLGRLILSLVILSTLAVWQPFPGKLPPMLH